jgi:hypothetical protein
MGPKIVKLDGRFNGFPYFSHYISYNSGLVLETTKQELFISNRVWFSLAFGTSCELNFHKTAMVFENKHVSKDWCWETEFNRMRIYVTKEALSHYVLTFGA